MQLLLMHTQMPSQPFKDGVPSKTHCSSLPCACRCDRVPHLETHLASLLGEFLPYLDLGSTNGITSSLTFSTEATGHPNFTSVKAG